MESPDKSNIEQTAQKLLKLIHQLNCELRTDNTLVEFPRLDTDLTNELGFDSLSRAELIHRAEAEFHVALPDDVLATARTPRDLLQEIARVSDGDTGAAVYKIIEQIELEVVESFPEHVESLQQLLDWHVSAHPKRPHLYIYESADQVTELSYQELKLGSMEMAGKLIEKGIEPGDCVAIMLPTCRDYFCSFFAVLYARAIPVPIYPPAHTSQIEDHLKRHVSILNNAKVKMLITASEVKLLSQLLRLQVPSIRSIVTITELQGGSDNFDIGDAKPSDIAFLQYTSGSTGTPKGVSLTHANLLANVRAMGKVVKASSSDVFVSWLPVYHDMGLIGAWFGSLYHAMPLVIMSPLVFLSKPQRWLWAVHRHGGTLSPAPNFAYELCINKIDEKDIEGLDLSNWRLSWNGAEPVSPSTIRKFTDKFSKYGFRPETMSPVYGLAESSVGLTFPVEVRKPRIERIQREALTRRGIAVNAVPEDQNALQVVGLGTPLPGHEIRIVDALGNEQPEREEGDVEFKGPSATHGYYREPDKTEELYHGEWLRSGDRGFTIDSELFLTGRRKDIIIRAGRNIYPQELEEAVNKVQGIRKGCVAVFACHDERRGTERVIVLAESYESDEEKQRQYKKQINKLSVELLGSAVDDVVICRPHTIPKTSSGKIRRSACKELYEHGHLDSRETAVWLQVIHMAFAGTRPVLRHSWRTAADICYAIYMWLIMVMVTPVVWLLVAILPNKDWCWSVTRWGAKTLIWLTRTKVDIKGLENIPDRGTSFIFTGNHCSYLDGLVLIAAISDKMRFIAKAELIKNPFTRIFLSKLNTEFVERFDVEKGVSDANRIASIVKEPQPLFIFPEGALFRMSGLHEFHLGGFIAAAQNRVPVVPVTLCGTRSKLRGSSLFPRRGDIQVYVSEPLYPENESWEAANKLKNSVRAEILNHCEEPDLGQAQTRQKKQLR